MKFLNEILNRPSSEKPFLLLVTGYPSADCHVPLIEKRPFEEMVDFIEAAHREN